MTALVDTNVLIRHLTGDPPAMGARATRALRGSETLFLTDVIFAECVFVLESVYALTRERVAQVLSAALALPAIAAFSKPLLIRTLEVYEGHRLDLPDAYLVAHAEVFGPSEVLSFDRSIDRATTVIRREP